MGSAQVRRRVMREAETERLLLRRWGPEHAPGLAAVNARPEVMHFLNGGAPLSREESNAVSERVALHWDTYGFGLWAAVEKLSRRTVGFIGICHPLWFPEWSDTVEVGWRLHPDAWGRGYATEGAREAMRVGFEERGLTEIVAFVHPDNDRSAAVAERLGMTLEQCVPHPGRAHDLDVYFARQTV